MNLDQMTLDLEQQIDVAGPIDAVFKGLLHRFGEGSVRADGIPMPMILEPWPGGRWFRDRGNGVGHLWGHVQVIKPPSLLEINGPMFMSYPALNHLEVRLEETAAGTRVILRHRALGFLNQDHKVGVGEGWKYYLDGLRGDFAKVG